MEYKHQRVLLKFSGKEKIIKRLRKEEKAVREIPT